jgi:hypothetical protein
MSHKLFNKRNLAIAATLIGAVALSGPGCIHSEDEVAAAVVAGEKPVAMAGSDTFFSGKLSVQVTLARGLGKGLRKNNDAGKSYSAFAHSSGATEIGNTVPPVTLHLIVTNLDSKAVTVQLLDFNSDLGDFAIDPDTLTIDPGASGEPTTMVSNLGVSSDEIPFTVTLKLGGVKETHVVKVRSLAVTASPANSK